MVLIVLLIDSIPRGIANRSRLLCWSQEGRSTGGVPDSPILSYVAKRHATFIVDL
jgi:hypothetical protein